MKTSLDTRKRLYREGKRLLGPDRMRRLRDGSLRTFQRARSLKRRALLVGERRRGPLWLDVERQTRIDATSVLIQGRCSTPGAPPIRWSAACNHGVANVTAHRYEDRRAALLANGSSAFVARVDLPADTCLTSLGLDCGNGRRIEARCPQPRESENVQARLIDLLAPLGDCTLARRALLDNAIGPAVTRAWATRHDIEAADSLRRIDYNSSRASQAPRTTIVVPLYGRHDFVMHQLAHFDHDASMHDVELLYVLDDPSLTERLERDAKALAERYSIAFSILYLERNGGYAAANNAGAAHARGKDLLLLNSDVLPAAPGWLTQLYASVDERLTGRVLGARLLYDDDTVQHDGMRFEQADNFEGLWLNRHPGKGLPCDVFVDSPSALPREAVTGACLLVEREQYLQLGGFDESYILGDYEDSDFCLKARRAGLGIALAPRAVLYHLERQSQSLVTRARWKDDLTHVNCWTHTARWHDDLLTLSDERDR